MALSLVAAACGGDDDDRPSRPRSRRPRARPRQPPNRPPRQPPNRPPKDGRGAAGESLLDGLIPCEHQYDGKTVSIFSPVRDSENDPATADFVAGYDPLAECTGVEIVWQGTDQFETEINVRLQGGDPPDVIDYPQPGLMANHVAQEFLVALPDDLATSTANDFISGLGLVRHVRWHRVRHSRSLQREVARLVQPVSGSPRPATRSRPRSKT